MYMKCDPNIDSTPAFPESGQAYGCSSDGADRTDCPVNLSGKERFAYEKREAALHKYEDAVRLYTQIFSSLLKIRLFLRGGFYHIRMPFFLFLRGR